MRAVWVLAVAVVGTVAGWPLFWSDWMRGESAVEVPPMLAAVREALPSDRRPAFAEFLGFVETYHKQYSDEAEVLKRFQNFEQNLNTAAELNAENNGAEFGITKFSDMTEDEFLDLHSGHVPLTHETVDSAAPLMPPNVRAPVADNLVDLAAIPNSWDWREDAIIGPVKDMGKCKAASYVFAALGAFESHWARKTGTAYSLSEQYYISCNALLPGCVQGHPSMVYTFIGDMKVVAKLADMPFKSGTADKEVTCKEVGDAFPDGAEISVYVNGTQMVANNEAALLQALANEGPVAVAISPKVLQTYKRGIVNEDTKAPRETVTHAVLLVGYGQEGPKNPYYIARNSMGADWGEEGHLRIRRGVNSLGIASWSATYPIIN